MAAAEARPAKIERPPMSNANLQSVIEKAWDARDGLNAKTKGEVRDAVETTLAMLDSGKLRVAEKTAGSKPGEGWVVHQWAKKAVLLSFRLQDNAIMPFTEGVGSSGSVSIGLTGMSVKGAAQTHSTAYGYDKVPLKFADWSPEQFAAAGFRAVPGAVVRRSGYIAKNVVLMPSFVNVGAYVDSGTMVDTWATVGSCAQIGKNVHLSGGVGIGGVLEPLQANPTIIEDNCFVGARSEVVEGVIVGEGSVISMGVFIGASTKVIDRATGKIHVGKVPPYSVVVSGSIPQGSMPGQNWGPSLYCAVIVKTVDAQTRAKTAINELLRD
jgi:2,3,4,5-tetrahydropyridine-2,6-dicarboxylate N-succinyltransferase